MRAQVLRLRGIIVGDDDGIVGDADVALESSEEVFGQVGSIPLSNGQIESLAELMNGGLSDEGHGHVPVADVQIKSPGALPPEGLIGIEEFFQVPALGVVFNEGVEGIVMARRQEAPEAIVGVVFTAALNDLVERVIALSMGEMERMCRDGQSDPRGLEGFFRNPF